MTGPKGTWWWKIYEIGGKIVLQCFCFVSQMFCVFQRNLCFPEIFYICSQNLWVLSERTQSFLRKCKNFLLSSPCPSISVWLFKGNWKWMGMFLWFLLCCFSHQIKNRGPAQFLTQFVAYIVKCERIWSIGNPDLVIWKSIYGYGCTKVRSITWSRMAKHNF